ncbi:MAG TPA: ABC transporter permease, partial [Thermoanaerobaculia bacterium]|nr:ABC transporter permease [Thermoanaerobaculia bacterium]
SALGAAAGLALGMGVVKLIAGFFPAGLPVSSFGILISTGFAVGVGLFAGLYPSLTAARLEPIEALRG